MDEERQLKGEVLPGGQGLLQKEETASGLGQVQPARIRGGPFSCPWSSHQELRNTGGWSGADGSMIPTWERFDLLISATEFVAFVSSPW
jgi:hypothetical protein